jgi:hypothetical protein
MDTQCAQETFSVDSSALADKYAYSQWHDYDFIYQLNDYIVEKNMCPRENVNSLENLQKYL